MPLRYPELLGGIGNEVFNANAYAAIFGLQGDDDFGGVSALAIGGSGNNYYSIGVPAIVTVMEPSGTSDAVAATEIGFGRTSTHAITLDSRHLFLFDTASAQAMVLLDWQQPANRVEFFVLSGTVYSYDQFAAAIAAFPRHEGNFTWEAASAAQYFSLSADETTAVINESLGYYRTTSVMKEQPVFAATNVDAGASFTIAAIPYTGPVGHLDLQFLGTDAIDGGLAPTSSPAATARTSSSSTVAATVPPGPPSPTGKWANSCPSGAGRPAPATRSGSPATAPRAGPA